MPTPRTPAEILEFHRRALVALRCLDRAFESLDEAERKDFPRRKEAFLDALEHMRDELDDEVVLALIASAERLLRLDYAARLGKKGAAAVRFGALESRFGGRVPLEEVLDVWKELAQAPSEAGGFKQMYAYRHGLAHGRHFNKSGVHEAEPEDVYEVIRALFDVVRGCAADFPTP